MVAIREVARRAGVSTMSVSRVLNDKPTVDENIRRRVLQAVRELNYTPSASARSLRRGQTKLLGVLVPGTDNPLYSRHVDGIREIAYAAGYGVFVCADGDGPGKQQTLDLLHQQRVAGVIATHPSGHIAALRRSGVAVVCIDHRDSRCDRVTVANLAATEQAVAHLARLGHRRIGLLTGPLAARSERERLVGYRRALRRLGLPVERRLHACAEGYADGDAIAAAGRLLDGADRPSAPLVSSSSLTPGVLVAIEAAGLRVPEDLALVTYGDLSWTPTLISPITALIEPAHEMGVVACRFLLERVEGRHDGPARTSLHAARLAIRLSCGAPAGERDPEALASGRLLFVSAAPAATIDAP